MQIHSRKTPSPPGEYLISKTDHIEETKPVGWLQSFPMVRDARSTHLLANNRQNVDLPAGD